MLQTLLEEKENNKDDMNSACPTKPTSKENLEKCLRLCLIKHDQWTSYWINRNFKTCHVKWNERTQILSCHYKFLTQSPSRYPWWINIYRRRWQFTIGPMHRFDDKIWEYAQSFQKTFLKNDKNKKRTFTPAKCKSLSNNFLEPLATFGITIALIFIST